VFGGLGGEIALSPLYGLVTLLAVFVFTELTWRAVRLRLNQPAYARVQPTDKTAPVIAGNRLGYWLGGALWWTALVLAYAVIDTSGANLYREAQVRGEFAGTLGAWAPSW
jgi:hypothetical protein